jgi:hypothetical protein
VPNEPLPVWPVEVVQEKFVQVKFEQSSVAVALPCALIQPTSAVLSLPPPHS